MKRFKLTNAAKILILILIVALVGGGIFAGLKTGLVKMPEKESTSTNKVDVSTEDKKNEETAGYDENGNVMTTKKETAETINLSLDEWTGWKSIIDAAGGLTTQPGSIFDNLGIKVNISVINDATQSSNALIKGDLDAAGYTINRTAFLSQKFTDAGVEIVMPFITNYSNGGDGIIAHSGIQTVNDLVGAKIGVPQFSEAHTLVAWFVQQSDLSQEDKDTIMNNLIFFATPDEAAKAFFVGEVDVAATWEPYLTQAKNMTDAHVFFSTASSSSLVMDGIVFNKEFVDSNPEVVQKFIQGTLMAADMYESEFDSIKQVMPMYATATNDDIIANCKVAKLTTWKDNVDLLNGTAKTIYSDMCDIWTTLGEQVNKNIVDTLFVDTYVKAVESEFNSMETSMDANKVLVTEDNMTEIMNTTALLQKHASVNFVINTSKFSDPAEATTVLNEFIETAKVLDGTIIEIAGNTDPNPISDPDDMANKMLSEQRAEAVKQYFVMNGISPNRIITVGNGSSNPIVENDTEEHKAMNRRTDVSFKIIE